MHTDNHDEKRRQDDFSWHRTSKGAENFLRYNSILAYYKAQSILEIVEGGSLLDLACGDGYLTKMIAGKFSRVVGVEASGAHVELAKKNVPGGEFFESLVEEFHTEERFDVITMIDLLEHLRDPVAALQKAAAFLKPEGALIVHVPNANAINRRFSVMMGTLASCDELSPYDINVAGHRRAYTRQSLGEDIAKAGLQVARTGGVFFKMLSTAQMDWFLENGLWEAGGFGWGRVGAERSKDWREEFCRASYEFGKLHPDDCNCIYACAKRAAEGHKHDA